MAVYFKHGDPLAVAGADRSISFFQRVVVGGRSPYEVATHPHVALNHRLEALMVAMGICYTPGKIRWKLKTTGF